MTDGADTREAATAPRPRPVLELGAGGRRVVLGESIWLMGVVNATPDSFSDAGRYPTLDARVARAGELIAAGATIVDIGGEAARAHQAAVGVAGGAGRLHELGRPLLMAISRKDFVGALTARPPAGRLAGSLAALAHGLDIGAQIFRMHDVAAAADFLAVRAALRGEVELAPDTVL